MHFHGTKEMKNIKLWFLFQKIVFFHPNKIVFFTLYNHYIQKILFTANDLLWFPNLDS